MIPTQQRLDGHHVFAVDIHQRLVPDRQPFEVLQRSAQIGGDALSRADRLVHHPLELAIFAAPAAFRFIERDVRFAHQFLAIYPIFRRQHQSNAGSAPNLAAKQRKGLAERLENTLRQRLDLSDVVDLRHHHQKFVAADAPHGIAGAHQAGETMGYGDNQFIAGVMAVGVVNIFKAVEIDQQQRHALFLPRRQRQRLGQPILYQRAVRQARQYVVKGQMQRLRFAGAELQHRLRQLKGGGPDPPHHVEAEQHHHQHGDAG